MLVHKSPMVIELITCKCLPLPTHTVSFFLHLKPRLLLYRAYSNVKQKQVDIRHTQSERAIWAGQVFSGIKSVQQAIKHTQQVLKTHSTCFRKHLAGIQTTFKVPWCSDGRTSTLLGCTCPFTTTIVIRPYVVMIASQTPEALLCEDVKLFDL
jgi:hypothetical protein